MRILSLSLLSFFLFNCSMISNVFEEKPLSVEDYYKNGIVLFDKEKFRKAKDKFLYVVENDPGSYLAIESALYLGKIHFELKEFEEASYQFSYYMMFSKDLANIETAQFMKCQCIYNLTNDYNKDQSKSFMAITELQEFINNFSSSPHKDKAILMINSLRNRIARKYYETGRLYLKMKNYDSAVHYFNLLLREYYDTKFADEARISNIFCYILADDFDKAKDYYNKESNNFISEDKLEEANLILKKYQDGIGFDGLYRLYK